MDRDERSHTANHSEKSSSSISSSSHSSIVEVRFFHPRSRYRISSPAYCCLLLLQNEASHSSNLLKQDDQSGPSSSSSMTSPAQAYTATTTLFATVTHTAAISSDNSNDDNAVTVVAVLIPLLLLATLLGVAFLWYRKRRQQGRRPSALFGKWRGTPEGSPRSPQSAELAWHEKSDGTGKSAVASLQRKEDSHLASFPTTNKLFGALNLLGPHHKRDRARGHGRHVASSHNKKSRSAAHHLRLRDISAPSNFQHRTDGRKHLLLAEQIDAVKWSAESGAAAAGDAVSLPPYTLSAGHKREKPAPLDIKAAVEAGKAVLAHSEAQRQKEAEATALRAPSRPRAAAAAPVRPHPAHRRQQSSRANVPKVLQPRVRSLRRKPIPLAPLPKAPGESDAKEALKTERSPTINEDSPVDRPMTRSASGSRASRTSNLSRPASGSTFFCQGSSEAQTAPPASASVQETRSKSSRTESLVADVKKLSVPSFNTRFSFLSSGSAVSEAHCQAPPNSLAGSAFKPDEEGDQSKRRSARASMFDTLRRKKIEM